MDTFVWNEEKNESRKREWLHPQIKKKMDTFVYNEEKITRIQKENGYGLISKNGCVRLQ